MDEGNWKLTAVQTDPIPYLGDICPRVSSGSAIQTEPGLLVKPPGIPEFLEHVIHERAAVAMTAQIRQDVQRRDVADARGVVIGILRGDHLTKRDALTLFLNEIDRPFGIGDPLRPERRAI